MTGKKLLVFIIALAVSSQWSVLHCNGQRITDNWQIITGTVTYDGEPLNVMVLANGQYMFTDAADGRYELEVPPDAGGQITLFAFCDKLAPFKAVLNSWEAGNYDIRMSPALPDSKNMTLTVNRTSAASGWVEINGTAAYNGTPLNAMVLANGQYTFTDPSDGRYELEVPPDQNGEVTVFGFCDGLAPYRQISEPPKERDEYIQEKWDEGYDISKMAYGDGSWTVVMSQGSGYDYQSYYADYYFPEVYIYGEWDEGYHITDLSYGDGTWFLVMSGGTGYTWQSCNITEDFPEQVIKEKWDEGYDITELTYGGGEWAVVTSYGTGYTYQSYHTRDSFPEEIIDEKQREGYHVTDLVYGDGMWAVVVSGGTGYDDQCQVMGTDFPGDAVSEKWKQGYHISDAVYGGGMWAVIMSRGIGYYAQAWGNNASDTAAFPDCTPEGQNAYVYSVMKNVYLWDDEIPEVDYTAYDSPEELLEDIMYESDRWSYITSKGEYHAYQEEGRFIGLGFGTKYDDNDDCRIRLVFENSPAHAAGIKRGDKLLKINGKTVEEIDDNDLWDTASGPDEPGVSCELTIEDSEGNARVITMLKDWVIINTVRYHDIFRIDGTNIGYLVFTSFIEKSLSELDSVFAEFSREGVDELILDLRYNGGGRSDVAQHLASLIAGNEAYGEIFLQTTHNDRHRNWDRAEYFTRPANALNLGRVVVITTEATCSASEAVINSLNPFINVAIVGDTTCGKPVGMHGYDFCDKHISPIEFEGVNAHGQGDYFDGISPTCYGDDDLSRLFGDTEEASLKEALYYITNGTCLDERKRNKARGAREIRLRGFRGEIGAF
ncbi:S41 family peptidase [Desulfococcaceae bacterium HSG8]|nr:S41 family peptidase [Desulfococcaceae bacterium HSG8]